MEIDFQYALSDEDARSRLEILATYLSNRHGIQVTWLETSAQATRARFHGEDPGFLWRGRAKDYIQGKLQKYLDPNATPAELPTS